MILTKTNKILLCFIIAISILFIGTLFFLDTQSHDMVLKIVGNDQKDENSFGSDIRIHSILLNNHEIPQKQIKSTDDWIYDSIYYVINANSSSEMEILFQSTDSLQVTFQRQCGSGYVNIYLNDELVQEKNLYSENQLTHTYSVTANKPFIYSALCYAAFFECLLIEFLVLMLLSQKITFLLSKYKIHVIIVMFLGATILHCAIEILNSNLFTLAPIYSLKNIILYFTIFLIGYALLRNVKYSITVGSLACFIFAIINYFVLENKGVPITPSDFYLIKTVVSVASNYEYTLPKTLWYAAPILVLALTIICNLPISKAPSRRNSLTALVLLMVNLFAIFNTNLYAEKMNFWQPQINLSTYGLGLNFVSELHASKVDVPDDYSPEFAKSILKTYETDYNGFTPNIIVVMNEAFSDLSILNNNIDNEEYLSYYNSLQENVIKGKALSSVIGGSTANSEYEFLTGNSMYFMANDVPYQQHIYHNTYNLSSVLKDRGYTNIAIHPYYASGYNRPAVYSYFEFDKFITIDDFQNYNLVRNLYISDVDSYSKVIETFEEIQKTDAPAFIFNVTMQNHGDYVSEYFVNSENLVQLKGYEGQFPPTEEYLSLIKIADSSIPVLIDYFSQIDEPTVILFFGDHQPYFGFDFYNSFSTNIKTALSNQNLSSVYTVPFFIWANYDIQEETDVFTSLNYLSAVLFEKTGIGCSSYQNYLLQLSKTIPAIYKLGYYTNDGIYIKKEDASKTEITDAIDESQLLSSEDANIIFSNDSNVSNSNIDKQKIQKLIDDYWYLEYYQIFDSNS